MLNIQGVVAVFPLELCGSFSTLKFCGILRWCFICYAVTAVMWLLAG